MRVLVTGSAGPLGAALVRTLSGWGDEVVGLDRRASATTHVVAALTDRAAVARALRGVAAVVDVSEFGAGSEPSRLRLAVTDAAAEGARVLLEAAAATRVEAYVRTSRLGRPAPDVPGAPARWIDDDAPVVLPADAASAAETAIANYCELFARHHRLHCIVLQIAGLLEPPGADAARGDVKFHAERDGGVGCRRLDELLHRRVDPEDAVSAHVLALHAAATGRGGRYLIAATTPFTRDDAAELAVAAPAVVARRVPAFAAVYRQRGWRMTGAIDHVLDAARARRDLGWQPRYDFGTAIARLARGESPGSRPWPYDGLSRDARPADGVAA